MKDRLPIFAQLIQSFWLVLAVVLGTASAAPAQVVSAEQDDAAAADAVSDGAQERKATILVRSAMAAIEQHDSVTAAVSVQIDALGRRIRGQGRYSQGDWQRRQLALEIKMPLDQTTAVLAHYCDGQKLWIHERLPQEETLRCVDVTQLAARLDQGFAPSAGAASVRALGLGGLPRLLRGLDHTFRFTAARLRHVNATPVWLLQGELRQARLSELLPGQKAAIEAGQTPDLTQLPPQVPDQALLVLGQEDLFPYRVEWRRSGATVRKQWRHWEADQGRAMLTIDFKDVQLNAPIDPQRFVFEPGDRPVTDATAEYLQGFTP